MKRTNRTIQLAPPVLPDEADHAGFVEAWLESAPALELSPGQWVALLDRAFHALWRRAEVTLGVVTLGAIADRVVQTAAVAHPVLSLLVIDETGPRFDGPRGAGATDADLPDAVELVLVEFLTVLGHLTDEILTPALHAELSSVKLDEPTAVERDGDHARGTP